MRYFLSFLLLTMVASNSAMADKTSRFVNRSKGAWNLDLVFDSVIGESAPGIECVASETDQLPIEATIVIKDSPLVGREKKVANTKALQFKLQGRKFRARRFGDDQIQVFGNAEQSESDGGRNLRIFSVESITGQKAKYASINYTISISYDSTNEFLCIFRYTGQMTQ